ncbi:MAG: hypothetical protein JWN22_652 [Nocardioides sp.]|jgi:hypothetical protein|nr:hypothetical protein [Nocardioides sp.]
MHEAILWCGFLGAWLLVAGPLYQAVLELEAEELQVDRIRALGETVPAPPEISAGWWLVPPVRWLLVRRRRERHQQEILNQMSDDDFDAMTGFVNKAVGWLLVGAGGFLIATKETWELVVGLAWAHVAFWLLMVLMFALSIGHIAARSAHTRRAADARSAERATDPH